MNDFEYKIFINNLKNNMTTVSDEMIAQSVTQLSLQQTIEAYSLINSWVVPVENAKHMIRVLRIFNNDSMYLKP